MSVSAEPPGQFGPVIGDAVAGGGAAEVRALLVRLRHGAQGAPSTEAAVHLLELVAREMTGLLGRYDRETMAAWRELGHQKCLAGEPAAAVHLLGQVLADLTQALGPADPDTLHAHLELATAIGDSGDPQTAVRRLQELLPSLSATVGAPDARTLTAQVRLAVNSGRVGDVVSAVHQLQGLIPQIQQTLGADHPLLGEARSGLARLVPQWRRIAGIGTGLGPIEAVAMVHRLLIWDFESDEEADACLADLARYTGQRNLAARLAAIPDTLSAEQATAVLLG